MTHGTIFGHITATRVAPDGTESHGWIDPQWSRTELFDSRNDVRPIIQESASDPDIAVLVADALLGEIGLPVDNGDGTYYGRDETMAPDGSVWTYAIHLTHKRHTSDGWVETPYALP